MVTKYHFQFSEWKKDFFSIFHWTMDIWTFSEIDSTHCGLTIFDHVHKMSRKVTTIFCHNICSHLYCFKKKTIVIWIFSWILRGPKVNLKNITNSWPFFSIHFLPLSTPEKNQITLEKIVLTVGQNNDGNKMPLL